MSTTTRGWSSSQFGPQRQLATKSSQPRFPLLLNILVTPYHTLFWEFCVQGFLQLDTFVVYVSRGLPKDILEVLGWVGGGVSLGGRKEEENLGLGFPRSVVCSVGSRWVGGTPSTYVKTRWEPSPSRRTEKEDLVFSVVSEWWDPDPGRLWTVGSCVCNGSSYLNDVIKI